MLGSQKRAFALFLKRLWRRVKKLKKKLNNNLLAFYNKPDQIDVCLIQQHQKIISYRNFTCRNDKIMSKFASNCLLDFIKKSKPKRK